MLFVMLNAELPPEVVPKIAYGATVELPVEHAVIVLHKAPSTECNHWAVKVLIVVQYLLGNVWAIPRVLDHPRFRALFRELPRHIWDCRNRRDLCLFLLLSE